MNAAMSRLLAIFLVIPLLPGPVDWAGAAQKDAEYAIEYVYATHPGLAAELQDADTLRSIAEARKFKDEHWRTVRDYASYVNFMRTLGRSFQDPHIGWRPVSHDGPRSGRSLNIYTDNSGKILWLHLRRLSYSDRPLLLRQIGASHQYSTIVIDLRGNQGGDSRVGDIFLGLFPEPRRQIMSPECPIAWRASSTTLAWTENERARIVRTDSQQSELLDKASQDIRAALNEKSGLTGEIKKKCLERNRPEENRAEITRRVILITDSQCYSSCLMTVEKLRLNGAFHFGSVTRRGNWYMDVATTTLPSKLGRFSTVQRVDLRRSYQIGPFVPDASDTCPRIEPAYRKCVVNLIATQR